jgi:hypothetical protein
VVLIGTALHHSVPESVVSGTTRSATRTIVATGPAARRVRKFIVFAILGLPQHVSIFGLERLLSVMEDVLPLTLRQRLARQGHVAGLTCLGKKFVGNRLVLLGVKSFASAKFLSRIGSYLAVQRHSYVTHSNTSSLNP